MAKVRTPKPIGPKSEVSSSVLRSHSGAVSGAAWAARTDTLGPNGIQTVIPKMFHVSMENYDKPYATIKFGGIQTIFRPEYIHLQWVQFQTDSMNTTFVSALSGLWHRHPEEIASSCNALRIQGSWNSRLRNAYLVVPRLIARYIRVGYAWFDLSSAIFDGFPKLCWRWVCPTRRLRGKGIL